MTPHFTNYFYHKFSSTVPLILSRLSFEGLLGSKLDHQSKIMMNVYHEKRGGLINIIKITAS